MEENGDEAEEEKQQAPMKENSERTELPGTDALQLKLLKNEGGRLSGPTTRNKSRSWWLTLVRAELLVLAPRFNMIWYYYEMQSSPGGSKPNRPPRAPVSGALGDHLGSS